MNKRSAPPKSDVTRLEDASTPASEGATDSAPKAARVVRAHESTAPAPLGGGGGAGGAARAGDSYNASAHGMFAGSVSTEEAAAAAGGGGADVHEQVASPAARAGVAPQLPQDVLVLVFGRLGVADLARAARVCRVWNAAIDSDARAWALAVVELDPFYSIGRTRMHAAFGGCGRSWLRVARTLTEARLPCSEVGCAAIGTMLCACPRASAATEVAPTMPAGAMTARPLLRCVDHCRASSHAVGMPATCVPILNKWVIAPLPPPGPGRTHVQGDHAGPGASARLAAAIRAAPAHSTIAITGRFMFGGGAGNSSMLLITKPIRIQGVGVAVIRTLNSVFVVAKIAAIVNVTIETGSPKEPAGGGGGPYEFYPAIDASEGTLLMSSVNVRSHSGTALLLGDGSNAFVEDCRFSSASKGPWFDAFDEYDGAKESPLCLGILAKTGCMLSVYGCHIEMCMWGIFAGSNAHKLKADNAFRRNDFDISAPTQYAYAGQVVQPWSTW